MISSALLLLVAGTQWHPVSNSFAVVKLGNDEQKVNVRLLWGDQRMGVLEVYSPKKRRLFREIGGWQWCAFAPLHPGEQAALIAYEYRGIDPPRANFYRYQGGHFKEVEHLKLSLPMRYLLSVCTKKAEDKKRFQCFVAQLHGGKHWLLAPMTSMR